jgi:hypothetical protein
VLRRHGLCSSHLSKWRKERKTGILHGLAPQKRGPKSKANPLTVENQKLRRDNERLTDRLRKAEIVIDVQKSGYAAGASDPASVRVADDTDNPRSCQVEAVTATQHGDNIIREPLTAVRGHLRAADFALRYSGDSARRIHVIVLARDRRTPCRPKALTSPFHYC